LGRSRPFFIVGLTAGVSSLVDEDHAAAFVRVVTALMPPGSEESPMAHRTARTTNLTIDGRAGPDEEAVEVAGLDEALAERDVNRATALTTAGENLWSEAVQFRALDLSSSNQFSTTTIWSGVPACTGRIIRKR
jgi:hypothetical protein